MAGKAPPLDLLQHTPVAVLLNHTLAALNELRAAGLGEGALRLLARKAHAQELGEGQPSVLVLREVNAVLVRHYVLLLRAVQARLLQVALLRRRKTRPVSRHGGRTRRTHVGTRRAGACSPRITVHGVPPALLQPSARSGCWRSCLRSARSS